MYRRNRPANKVVSKMGAARSLLTAAPTRTLQNMTVDFDIRISCPLATEQA